MIKIENTEVFGWEAAIRGMRNPMNSWDKSDSEYKVRCSEPGLEGKIWCDNCGYDNCNPYAVSDGEFVIGSNDFNLMKQLVKGGSDHAKFMRMINVTCDITAPMYWTKEHDTYKVATVRNSCSTMHKIHAKEFTLDDFSHEHLEDCFKDNLGTLCKADSVQVLMVVINCLNYMRERYLDTKDKTYWWQMIQLLPSSYNQRYTWQANYATLRNIYHSRKNHKLDEWHDFCEWIESLPYSELITM